MSSHSRLPRPRAPFAPETSSCLDLLLTGRLSFMADLPRKVSASRLCADRRASSASLHLPGAPRQRSSAVFPRRRRREDPLGQRDTGLAARRLATSLFPRRAASYHRNDRPGEESNLPGNILGGRTPRWAGFQRWNGEFLPRLDHA